MSAIVLGRRQRTVLLACGIVGMVLLAADVSGATGDHARGAARVPA